jgi:hypothetical protein
MFAYEQTAVPMVCSIGTTGSYVNNGREPDVAALQEIKPAKVDGLLKFSA